MQIFANQWWWKNLGQVKIQFVQRKPFSAFFQVAEIGLSENFSIELMRSRIKVGWNRIYNIDL